MQHTGGQNAHASIFTNTHPRGRLGRKGDDKGNDGGEGSGSAGLLTLVLHSQRGGFLRSCFWFSRVGEGKERY